MKPLLPIAITSVALLGVAVSVPRAVAADGTVQPAPGDVAQVAELLALAKLHQDNLTTHALIAQGHAQKTAAVGQAGAAEQLRKAIQLKPY